MFRWTITGLLALVLLVTVPCPAPSCSLCGLNLQQAPTFRQEAAQSSARMILYGTFTESTPGTGSNGTTKMRIETVLRSDPWLKDKKDIVLPRYQPVDKDNPPKYLVFADLYKDKLDPYRGVPVKGPEAAEYVKKALELDPKDRPASLAFFFRYLENADKAVATDAFLEFAKATDQEIGQAAAKFSPEKIRGWLEEKNTPEERLGVYAFLLGACGTAKDAAYLEGLLKRRDERTVKAYDGILSGYMRLEHAKGWELATNTLKEGKEKLPVRLAVVRAVHFHQNLQPKENREKVLQAAEAMIVQGELADIAVDDLCRWQIWDRTPEVLGLYGKKGYDAPLLKRKLVRYALCAKDDPMVRQFLAERRRTEADLVKEVEDALEQEKK
jgi:hypothetical protein